MKIHLVSGGLEKIKTDALIFLVYQNEDFSSEILSVDNNLGGVFGDIVKKKYFHAETGQIYTVHTHGKIKSDKIILVGLGEKEKSSLENLRRKVAEALNFAKSISVKDCVLILPDNDTSIISDIGVAIGISQYNFINYKTKDLDKIKKIDSVGIYGQNNLNSDLDKSRIIAEAVNWVRDLINHPSNYITPTILADHTRKVKSSNIKISVLGKREITKEKMGLLLGVSKGTEEEPRFIILDYKPPRLRSLNSTRDKSGQAKIKDQKLKTIVLIGKGLTFDSGGISLKSSEKMDEMKMDMAGAAAVMGVFKVIGKIQPKMRIIGLIPATENLPSGKAIKPGDILTSMSGQTVEIINTDAEGRLVLADALTYAQKFNPDLIIDIATLTGACLVALGEDAAGVLGNNQEYIEMLRKSSEKTGERVWQLPIWDDHRELMKSEIADLKNSSGSKYAGTITGAVFLENFVEKKPWIHLDIAGTAYSDKPKPYNPKGASGYGVRLIIDFIENWKY